MAECHHLHDASALRYGWCHARKDLRIAGLLHRPRPGTGRRTVEPADRSRRVVRGDDALRRVPAAAPDRDEHPAEPSGLTAKNLLESYHDAQQALDQALNLFSLGYLSLEQR